MFLKYTVDQKMNIPGGSSITSEDIFVAHPFILFNAEASVVIIFVFSFFARNSLVIKETESLTIFVQCFLNASF